jgi:hypothetical protein
MPGQLNAKPNHDVQSTENEKYLQCRMTLMVSRLPEKMLSKKKGNTEGRRRRKLLVKNKGDKQCLWLLSWM